MVERRDGDRVLVGKTEKDPRLDGRIILKWIFEWFDGGL
jgi:hypothetical protein